MLHFACALLCSIYFALCVLHCALIFMNTLYYGDNLKILREYIKDERIDLIYLDPPF